MTYRTVQMRSFEDYLRDERTGGAMEPAGYQLTADHERLAALAAFPHAVVLELSLAELDFANRWCWSRFGPAHGVCTDHESEYPSCRLQDPHEHEGRWQWIWLGKTDYAFGYCEWYFADLARLRQFVDFVPQIHWGEKFPR